MIAELILRVGIGYICEGHFCKTAASVNALQYQHIAHAARVTGLVRKQHPGVCGICPARERLAWKLIKAEVTCVANESALQIDN